MRKVPAIFRNKYFLSTTFVLVYVLIMHDSDIFALMKRHEKVSMLETEIERKQTAIEDLKVTLASLDDVRTIEKYAREEHYFKKDDEVIFIFSFE